MATYFAKKKRGNTYELEVAQCKKCGESDIESKDGKYYCEKCKEEYIEDEILEDKM